MIEKLTKEQEATIIPFREEWRKIGLSKERVDKEMTKKAFTGLYEKIGRNPPLFIFCPSPLFAFYQINLFKFLSKDLKIEISEGNNLQNNLWSNLESNLESNLQSNLWNNLESNLRSNLESNLESNLWSNLWSNQKTDKEFLEFHQLWAYGQMDSAWIAFYQFMETIGIKYDDKDSTLLELWAQTAKSCSWFWTFENYVFISDRPTKLMFDTEWRLHNEHGASYEYSDGWSGYYLHGVHFPKDLFLKVISREMEMKDILNITDIDQRVQAMKFAKNGLRDFYLSENGKMIDSLAKQSFNGDEIKYELWEIPAGKTFNKIVHFSVYDCPSAKKRGEQREYAKGTPVELMTVAESLAWGMSSDENIVTPETWLNLLPLIHES